MTLYFVSLEKITLVLVLGFLLGFIIVTCYGFYKSWADNKRLETDVKNKKPYSDDLLNEIMENHARQNNDGMWHTTTTTTYKPFFGTVEKEEENLDEELAKAVSVEDYEKAAVIRDKINKNKTTTKIK